MPRDQVDMLLELIILRRLFNRKKTKEYKRKKLSKNIAIVVANVLLFSMVIVGIYAQILFNRESDLFEIATNHYARIHESYIDLGDGIRNKSIFVENFGENRVFVRVRLREFLSVDGNLIGTNAISDSMPISISDVDTWPIYESDMNNVHLRRAGTSSAMIGNAGISWQLGDYNYSRKVFMPTFNHVTREALSFDSNVPMAFQNLNTFMMAETSNTIRRNISGGIRDHWLVGDVHVSDLITIDSYDRIVTSGQVIHYARETLTPTHEGGIMTMSQWNSLGRPRGNFWVHDTENSGGWFYWSGSLYGGEATTLLLDSMTIETSGRVEYDIVIESTFVIEDQVDYLPDLSDDAKMLWIGTDEFHLFHIDDESEISFHP